MFQISSQVYHDKSSTKIPLRRKHLQESMVKAWKMLEQALLIYFDLYIFCFSKKKKNYCERIRIFKQNKHFFFFFFLTTNSMISPFKLFSSSMSTNNRQPSVERDTGFFLAIFVENDIFPKRKANQNQNCQNFNSKKQAKHKKKRIAKKRI